MGYQTMSRRAAAQKSLPYDAEVEYLYFNGNCNIFTKYIPFGDDIRIRTKIKYIGYVDTTSYVGWFAAYSAEDTGTHRIIRSGNTNTRVLIYNGGRANGGGTNFDVAENTIYEIDINRTTCKINNTSLSLNYYPNKLNRNYLYIGHTKTKLWYYYFQLYKNNKLILDFIPVRIGNVGYMYDKVSGQLFGNSSGGNFILGPDK